MFALVWRSLRYYARSHIAVGLGVLAATTAMTGALLVGDALRGSLRAQVLGRLGAVDAVVSTPRLFDAALAARITTGGPGSLATGGAAGDPNDIHCAAALVLRGSAAAGEVGPASLPAAAGTEARPTYDQVPTDQRASGTGRSNSVHIFGIDAPYDGVAGAALAAPLAAQPRGVVLNAALAADLGARSGDEILLTVARPTAISPETLLGRRDEPTSTLRLTVAQIAPDGGPADLSLFPQQLPPRNAFVPLALLQRVLAQPGRANTLLFAEGATRSATGARAVPATRAAPTDFDARLAAALRPADVGVHCRTLADQGCVVLESDALLIEPPIEAAARQTGADAGATTVGVLAYLVNRMYQRNAADALVPYSTVAAIERPAGDVPAAIADLIPPDDDSVVLNDWAARELKADPDDTLRLIYLTYGQSLEGTERAQAGDVDKLVEQTQSRQVARVVPLAGATADPNWVPRYPGVTDSDNIADWHPPFPIELAHIRPQDEAYWHAHHTTPKAFITLKTGQAWWTAQRPELGQVTALRFYPRAGQSLDELRAALETALARRMTPAALGLAVSPLRQELLAAAEGTTDFAGLFVGFSFFLIVAALLLAGLLFRLSIERRAAELGLLAATGFTRPRIARLLVAEGALVAGVSAAVGLLAARGYAWLLVELLRTRWSAAVHAPFLRLHDGVTSYALGYGLSVAIAVLTLWWSLRGLLRVPPRALLAGEISAPEPTRPWSRSLALVIALVASVTAVAGAVLAGRGSGALVAGAALLIAGVAVIDLWLRRAPVGTPSAPVRTPSAPVRTPSAPVRTPSAPVRTPSAPVRTPSATRGSSAQGYDRGAVPPLPLLAEGVRIVALSLRNLSHHRGRTRTTIAAIAAAVFVLVTLEAARIGSDDLLGDGGFALLAESAVPVLSNLGTPEGRAAAGLPPDDEAAFAHTEIVGFQVSDGDEASCLNLYQPRQPRILGVPPAPSLERHFYLKTHNRPHSSHSLFVSVAYASIPPWQTFYLADRWAADEEPLFAVADEATAQWQLHLRLGEQFIIHDDHGALHTLSLSGVLESSVLQGSLLIGDRAFARLFPRTSGRALWLIDAPPDRIEAVTRALTVGLSRYGMQVTPTRQRLAELAAVQNTYISAFQLLGGLGLVLGTLGVAALVLRHVLERRRELALLQALGFPTSRIAAMMLAEHLALIVGGVVVGVAAAALAVMPQLHGQTAVAIAGSILRVSGVVLLTGLLATGGALALALRGRLLPALRSE